MTTKRDIRSVRNGVTRGMLASGAVACALLGGGACSDLNSPTQDDLIQNPTRAKLSAAATGLFSGARTGTAGEEGGIQQFIWRVGSMGREGINLSGNNQADYGEPFYGPVLGSGFGRFLWFDRYAHIRSINIYLTALSRTTELSAAEVAASRGVANTLKALAFMYIVETRDSLGAPVDVDLRVNAPPAPFVSKDSVYRYVLGLLDSAQADLGRAGGVAFPFPIPPGLSGGVTNALDFSAPTTFVRFNRALAGKAQILRATSAGCGAPCFTAALIALGGSFISSDPADFAKGAYFGFSNGPGDTPNTLSEPLSGTTYFAPDTSKNPDSSTVIKDARKQPNGQPDQRVLDKTAPATSTHTLAGVPFEGTRKFTVYFTGGADDPNHAIPIIRDEELILLRAEANLGLGNISGAITDIDLVRVNAGKLAPYSGPPTREPVLDELLYNRRYSLLWEHGTRWIDAKRYNRLGTIPPAVPGGNVPTVMPIPDAECSARGLGSNCDPLRTP